MLQKLYGSPKRQKSKAINNISLLNNRSLAIQNVISHKYFTHLILVIDFSIFLNIVCQNGG